MTRTCRRSLGLLTLAALTLGACARVRPLSGGPADETPPQLLAASPQDSSTLIPRTPELRLHFDEKISVASLRRGLRTYPHVRVSDVHLDGTSAVVVFADTVPADTTWAVVLGRSVQDLPKRDNPIPQDIWLLYSTGASIQSTGVVGRVAVLGKPEPKGAVLYEPIQTDSSAADSSVSAARPRRSAPRYPATATDDEGLFRLLGIPPERPFRLIGFVDGNGNLMPDEAELQAASDTLRLLNGEIERGLQFNLVDPNEPAVIEGTVLNTTSLDAPVVVALYAVSDSAAPDTSSAVSTDDVLEHLSDAAADSSGASRLAADSIAAAPGTADSLATSDVDVAIADSLGTDSLRVDLRSMGALADSSELRRVAPPRGAPDSRTSFDSLAMTPVPTRADTVRPLPLPVAERAASAWEDAYASLEPEGFVRRRWRIVYASRRGDYSVKVPAGRHRLIASADASADSAPGMYVRPDSTLLEWEPLWVGGILEVAPGEIRRPRAIEIKRSP